MIIWYYFNLTNRFKKMLYYLSKVLNVYIKKVKIVLLLIRIIRNHHKIILSYRILCFQINMMKLYCHQSVHYHLMLLNNQLQVKLLQLTIILIIILILKQTSLKLIKRSINNNMIEDKVKESKTHIWKNKKIIFHKMCVVLI